MRIQWSEHELLLATELVFDNSWRPLDDSSSKVKELSWLLRQWALMSDIELDEKFRSPSSVALKTRNIASLHPDWQGSPSNSGKNDLIALKRFLEDPESAKRDCLEIWSSVSDGDTSPRAKSGQTTPSLEEALEGRIRQINMAKRERDPALRKAKISSMKASESGVCCEVCNFDFAATYGDRGKDYIEVHHVTPLHVSGQVLTSMQDLIGLCANCHRMIHRWKWMTPDELRFTIKNVSNGN